MHKTLAQRLSDVMAKIQKQHPDAVLALNLGAQEHELLELEETIAAPLPEDFKQIYRQINGQQEDGANVFDGEEWLSLERITEEWQQWKKRWDKHAWLQSDGTELASKPVDDGIRNDWWSPLWIPFTYDGAGNHLCLDLNPSLSGRYGQIIRVWQDDAERRLEATSFEEWLDGYVEGLEESDYIYAEEYDAIIDADQLYAEEDDEAWLAQQELQEQWQSARDDFSRGLADMLGQEPESVKAWLETVQQTAEGDADALNWDAIEDALTEWNADDGDSEDDDDSGHALPSPKKSMTKQ